MTNLNNIVNDIGQYLKHQIEEGQTNIEISQEIMEKLSNQEKPQTANNTRAPQPAIKPVAKTAVKATPTVAAPTPKPVVPAPTPIVQEIPKSKKDDITTPAINATSCSNMDEIAALISVCTSCSLCKTRTNTVPGQGNNNPEIMFIGEAPGAKEDEQGFPFVGRSITSLSSQSRNSNGAGDMPQPAKNIMSLLLLACMVVD